MLAVLKIIESVKNKSVYKKLNSIVPDSKKGIRLAYNDIRMSLKRQIFADLDSPDKTGRLYIIYKDGETFLHRASAAGEPPATLFGGLKDSIETKVDASDQMTISAGNTKVRYARSLELGDSLVAKRPYLKKAIDDQERNTANYFREYLKEVLSEA